MDLTSGWLIGFAAVATLAALTATLRAWPRLASTTPRHLLERAVLLIVTQVAMLLLIFLSVNASGEFFATWSDLFGTNHTTGVIAPASHAASGQPSPAASGRTGGLLTPIGTAGSPALTGLRGRAELGELQLVRITGLRSGIGVSAYLYLPPQYFRPARTGQRFPVIVAVSDHVTAAGDAYSAASLAATAAAEIEAGRARPAIYVMVPVAVADPRDRGCLDVPGGPQAATFFTQDLPAAIEAAYPASQSAAGWAVLGDAGGGYCAIGLAMAHSDRFGVAAAPLAQYGLPPGADDLRPGSVGWWMFGGSAALRDESDLRWRLRYWPAQPISLLFLRAPAATPGPRPGSSGTSAPASATPSPVQLFVSLSVPPASVAELTLAAGPRPLAPALDRISAALSAGGVP